MTDDTSQLPADSYTRRRARPGDARPSLPPTKMPAGEHSRRAVLTAGGLGIASLLVVGLGSGPRPIVLGAAQGDTALAQALEPHLGGHRAVAVTVVEDGQPRFAGFGADERREYEIGSISKTFTGALLLDAVKRSELTLDTTVAEVLGDRAAGSALADATMEALASHSAGLPNGPGVSVLHDQVRRDPYRQTPEQVIDLALREELENVGQFSYSNLSVSLLGQLIAHRAGFPWEDLLRTRLAEPLGMSATWAPITEDRLRESSPLGHDVAGRTAGAWTLGGWAPSGGIRSTAADMRTWLTSMITGSNPGAQGLTPVVDSEEQRIGITWINSPLPSGDGRVTWHNGGTRGFSSFLGWSPETRRGVVVLSDTEKSVDDLGIGILDGKVALA